MYFKIVETTPMAHLSTQPPAHKVLCSPPNLAQSQIRWELITVTFKIMKQKKPALLFSPMAQGKQLLPKGFLLSH